MPEKKPYRLIPQRLPATRHRRSVYADVLEEFIGSGEHSSIVQFQDRSAATIYAGLMHAIKTGGVADVSARRRSGDVYLEREK